VPSLSGHGGHFDAKKCRKSGTAQVISPNDILDQDELEQYDEWRLASN
jgi:hypothetical protein